MLDWLGQLPDPVRAPRRRPQPPATDLPLGVPLPLAWPSETTVILGGKTWQYPAYTESPAPPPPPLAWPSETTVILGGKTWQYPAYTESLLPLLPVLLDWLGQLPDPLRRPLHPYYYPPVEIRVPIRRRPPRYEVRLRGFRRRPARF